NSEAWLQYAVRRNLLNEKQENIIELKNKALQDEKITAYLNDITDFHSIIVSNHKNPDLPIHKLLFLLDIGLDDTEEVQCAINEIMKHKDENGVYLSLTNIPKHFGGSGEDAFGWCLCDAPLLLLALLKVNVDYEKHIKQGVDYLAALFQNQGYPCAVSREHGKFRGPGRKDDCCPYATLIMLKLFSEIPEYRDSELACDSADGLLSLWENSLQSHPYMFYMGTDFRKLKAPAMWYDIVSVADALSRFDSVKKDIRFLEIISIIKDKQNPNGLFTPESIYQKCGGWDFGQKKASSPYLTYLCARIFQRTEL
ncbi:MAG: hypothetical protein KBI01_10465, partial [Oscillospiraceae bacterium]|nr:hypothetical protein [Oscillospiraceae bacterium]